MVIMPRTLRFRVVLLLLVAFLLSAGAFAWTMDRVMVSNVEQLEIEQVNGAVVRVRAAIQQEIAQVGGIAGALAAQESGSHTVSPDAMADVGVDFVLVADAQGQVIGSTFREVSSGLASGTISRPSPTG